MKTKGGKKPKPQLYSHIASAIIPVTSIIAVPSAAQHFPQQKTRGNEQWGPLASTLLRASVTNQMLIPQSSRSSLRPDDDDDDDDDDDEDYTHSKKQTSFGRMDASSDEDENDDDGERKKRQTHKYPVRSSVSRTASLSNAEKRIFGQILTDEEPTTTTTAEPGLSSTIHLDPKQALTAELARSTTTSTTSTDDKILKRATVTVTRQQVPPLNFNPAPSQTGPTSARANTQIDGVPTEAKSLTTARSSINDTTTIPASARSVTFKDEVIHETYDSQSSNVLKHQDSVLERLVIPPPEEYQHNYHDLEKRNQLLNDEIQQLRLTNRNLQKQQDELLNRLQTSQKLSQRELNELLKQAGHDQTKDLENLNKTLQNRCEQLQNELISLRERYAQDQGQPSSARDLKNENHFLKDYIHRLNTAASEYQATHPPDVLKKDTNRDQRKVQGLPIKGPTPIWLLDQKFLAPLFVCYDEKLHEKDEFIRKLQVQFNELQEQVKLIANENLSLHERLARTSSSAIHQNVLHSSDVDNIKKQAYLVLEENKVLQEQLNLQTNRLNDIQKSQMDEVSNLTRRLMVAESEKSDADRTLETVRIRNEELRKKYEQSIMENDHRIHLDDHLREINEMKRITDELIEKHASEMKLLLHRVKDAEETKKSTLLKLTESRHNLEQLKSELKETRKTNKKLQLRMQTYENKLQLQQLKEQQITAMLDKTKDDLDKTKFERENTSISAKTKEDEINKARERMLEESKKLIELENRLENYKIKSKEHVNEVQEQMKKQYDNLKIRCADHEQRIQQLLTLLNEKQIIIDDLSSEKRNLEADLEQIWITTHADNMRMREQLHDMRVAS